jgi:two-component system, sensor histidine kinase and response regulator
MKHAILCVDDEIDNVDALERLFRRQYRVLKATSGKEALDLLAKNQVTVIISDQRMPNMSGVEFLAESIKTHPLAIRILLTGYTDIESVIAAINAGQIYRYVTKPWDPVDLSNAVDKAVERYELGIELHDKNIALQNALDELKSLDEAKSNFMILINHELKTPLTAILSFSDLLAESNLDSEQKTYLARIKQSTDRLHQLVQDSLELVSAETSQMKIDKKSLKVASLFAAIPEPAASTAATRQVKFDVDVESASVKADEKLLLNVVRRILHNAAKFADQGSTVKVRGKVFDDGYEISVANAGKPIEERKILQIFKPFTLNESVMNHTTGTGLGLSVCQALLRAHGSTLNFSSNKNTIQLSFKL